MLALTLIQSNPTAGALELGYIGLKIASILCGKSLISTTLGFGKSYLDTNLKKLINKKSIDQLLLNKEHLHKILAIDGSSEVTANLSSDLQSCLMFGEGLLLSITSAKIKEAAALKEVMILGPEALILQQIRGFLKKSITELVQKKLSPHKECLAKIDADQFSIVSDLCTNFGNAVLTDSTEFIKTRYNNNIDKKASIELKSMLWDQFGTIMTSVLEVAEKFIDVVYYAYKITNGQLTIEQAPLLYSWLQDTSPLFQGGFTLNYSGAAITQARVDKLLKAILSDTRTIAFHSFNDDNKIIINNYNLKIKDQAALNIDHLELVVGKHYAMSGASGLGKTSFLKDVQGCLTNPLSSSGEISLPTINAKEIKPMFIDQNLYIPAGATIFEAITLKSSNMLDNGAKLLLKTKIIKLFKLFAIDARAAIGDETTGLISELDNPNFNTANLSGGKKKKIGIIKLILTKPEIAIMDEVFVGLDKKSLITAQKLITKYLPTTTLIIVDHTAENNNYDNFYDTEINFTIDSQCIHEVSSKDSLSEVGMLGLDI